MYEKDPKTSKYFGRIVSTHHAQRLKNLLDENPSLQGEVCFFLKLFFLIIKSLNQKLIDWYFDYWLIVTFSPRNYVVVK